MQRMRYRLFLFVAALIAIASVGLLSRRSPARDAAGVLGTAIEGLYTQRHDVRSVDGVETAEDVVEIIRYDPSHIYVDVKAHFDNGHSCSMSGIAAFEGDDSFVYRTRQFLLDADPTCTLTVAVTRDELRITDRLTSDGPDTCRGFCGIRGNLSNFAIARNQRRPVPDLTRVKRSEAFRAAVEELDSETTVRK
jgi:hypothetical protein